MQNMFQRLVDALQVLPSHDAADQGFLDNFFSDLIDAPMFNASRGRHGSYSTDCPAAARTDR
jgi:hypothetical protein